MSADFFKTALLGPITTQPLEVAGSCTECMAIVSPRDADACAGFGPGCIGMRRTAPAVTDPTDLTVHLRDPRRVD